MSLTVVDRPVSNTLTGTELAVTVSDSGGDALFTYVTHGLTTGDYIYMKTPVGDYNGFWYVTVIDPDTFKISEYATASFVGFLKITTGIFQKATSSANRWVCVHLPIIYKLQSDIWPINGVDTARSVSSFSSYNGYTALNLSGDIKSSGVAAALEQIIIDGTSSLDGVYTILNWFSDSSIVIDLPYSAGNSFSGGTVQYYYFNYHAVIRVYAGLQAAHTWAALNPFEQVAELKCVPNATGLITVNIADYVKKKIDILTNDLLLASLPNNIDAFCFFYIEHAESYDDSNGYTVSEFTSSFTSELSTYNGRALNAKQPFKDVYTGQMGQYHGQGQKFLTNHTEPKLFPDQFFDLSFLISTAATYRIQRDLYIDDVFVATEFDEIANNGIGVYRHTIAQSGFSEDRIDVTLLNSSSSAISETLTVLVSERCEDQSLNLTWLNNLAGFDYWNFTAKKTYSINVEESLTQEKNIYTNWPNSYGEFADTIRQQTGRTGRYTVRVESQHMTLAQLNAVKLIVASPLVQIVNSIYDRRTVLVDASSLRTHKDGDAEDQHTIAFTISYTDEIPSQSL